jgi:Tol biopolymer transport system component
MGLIAAAVAGGLIAFTSGPETGPETFVMRPDGSGVRQITHNPPYGSASGEFSPDGRRLTVNGVVSGVANTDGSGQPVRIGEADEVRWAPGGRRIAYKRYGVDARATTVFVANADGSGARSVTPGVQRRFGLSWSPDGSRIAFAGGPTGSELPHDNNVFVANADGSGVTQLTHVPERPGVPWPQGARDPAWSPDGRRIAYSTDEVAFGALRLAVMNADGSDQRTLSNVVTAASPAWSPDGRQIAYSDWADSSEEAFVVDAAGGDPRRLTRNTVPDEVSD